MIWGVRSGGSARDELKTDASLLFTLSFPGERGRGRLDVGTRVLLKVPI